MPVDVGTYLRLNRLCSDRGFSKLETIQFLQTMIAKFIDFHLSRHVSEHTKYTNIIKQE